MLEVEIILIIQMMILYYFSYCWCKFDIRINIKKFVILFNAYLCVIRLNLTETIKYENISMNEYYTYFNVRNIILYNTAQLSYII